MAFARDRRRRRPKRRREPAAPPASAVPRPCAQYPARAVPASARRESPGGGAPAPCAPALGPSSVEGRPGILEETERKLAAGEEGREDGGPRSRFGSVQEAARLARPRTCEAAARPDRPSSSKALSLPRSGRGGTQQRCMSLPGGPVEGVAASPGRAHLRGSHPRTDAPSPGGVAAR